MAPFAAGDRAMKLYWCPKTRAVRAVWLLEELEVPYERVLINIRDEAAQNDAGFRAVSPMGKVPALEDGPTRLWDSGAMCAYLADRYPAAGLAPPIGHPDRGAYLQWLMFTNSVIEPAMGEKMGGAKPNPVAYGWGSFDKMLATLRGGVKSGPWILGERFSAADVLLGLSCYYLRQFKMIDDDPALSAYADRCVSRPAYQRATAIDAAGT
jgi:glutathione S-transferase